MRENYSIRVFNNLAINTEKALSVKVFYCLKGKCEITINVQKHTLKKDDIAFVVMNDTYSLLSNTDTMCCIIDIPIHRYTSQKDTQFLISGTKIDERSRDRIKYWILKILELHCLSYNDVSEIQRLIQFLLIELSYLKKPKLDVNKDFYLSEDIHQYLVDHHDSKINKHELAEAVNLSNQALTSMFKQTPFQTFNQYLNQLRLKFCLIDILTTHKPIEEIAIDHGFHHYSRFIQLFKNTYGYTPKLIRRDYIATSIFKNTAEEIDLDRHFLMNIHELQDLDSKIISKKYIEMSDKEKKYRSYDIYIEDNRSTILDQEQIIHIKRNLSLSQKSMRYVIDLNYTSMIENKELCRYEMLKILRFCSGLNLIPTFKIITDRHDTFTSKEKMALKLTFQMLFIMLREFNQLEIEFIVEDMMLKQVVQLKKMISSYFEYYKLNYRIKNEKNGNVNYQNLEKQVTQIFIPINQLHLYIKEISFEKVILETSYLTDLKSEIVEYPWIQHIHTLIKMCGEVRGVLIQPSSDYATTVTYHSNLKPYHILSYVIRMFNQLRGTIVYKDDAIIMTKYKYEYQAIAISLKNTIKENANHQQLIFSDIQSLNHAEYEYIEMIPLLMNENDELDSHISYPHQYWLAKLKSKESQQAIVDLPKMSIAHLTFLCS